MENVKQHFGKKLRDLRKKKGFKTQKALADAIGADRTRVSRWESGENSPDPVYKDALAEKLGVSADFFETIENHAPAKIQGDQSKAQLILDIQAKLTSLDENQLQSALSFIETSLGPGSGVLDNPSDTVKLTK